MENLLFRWRAVVLGLLLIATVWLGWLATHLQLDAGFLKQLPSDHPYVETFIDYRDKLPGPNAVMVAVEVQAGDVGTPD
ncbi:MAG: hypothetical protein MI810_19250, partial [Flavobacteriales bacterium]|nr:hypothetical protein [Flavobacteriales bacterium]